jgi:hypothetical protein
MTKHTLSKKVAQQIRLEAEQIARSLRTPDQTREQTRLIARGIQRGIETYRRQQADSARHFDRETKRLKKQETDQESPMPLVEERTIYRQHWLPWVLLASSLALNIYLITSG